MQKSIILLNIFLLAYCADLSISPTYYASSIAVYRNRAFLALSRNSCYNNLTNPTLIEVHWNGNNQLLNTVRKSPFNQIWDKCNQLQNIVALDVELKKGRLWVLDNGNKKCPPKIVVYNLFTYTELHQCNLNEFIQEDMSSLVIDYSADYGSLCYVGQKTSNKLVVFSFNNLKWCTVSIIGGIMPERISVSKTDSSLFITSDNSDELFALNLTDIRKIGSKTIMVDQAVHTLYIGKKLGLSGGFVADIAGGLNYYLTRDYAVVRWISSKPLMAEYHDVLLQSYETLPYVPQLFNDPQNNLWALINHSLPQKCNNEKDRRYFQLLNVTAPQIARVVRLSKFYKLGIRKKIFTPGYY